MSVKAKVLFKSTPGMKSYHDQRDWLDGDSREIDVDVAKRLVEDFPDNFSFASKSINTRPSNKMVSSPKGNKGKKGKKK